MTVSPLDRIKTARLANYSDSSPPNELEFVSQLKPLLIEGLSKDEAADMLVLFVRDVDSGKVPCRKYGFDNEYSVILTDEQIADYENRLKGVINPWHFKYDRITFITGNIYDPPSLCDIILIQYYFTRRAIHDWLIHIGLTANSALNGWLDSGFPSEVKDAGIDSQDAAEPEGVSDKPSHPRRTAIYTAWYATLCAKYNDDTGLISLEVNRLKNNDEIIECWKLAPQNEKSIWANINHSTQLPEPIKAAQEWFSRNAYKIRGFKKDAGK